MNGVHARLLEPAADLHRLLERVALPVPRKHLVVPFLGADLELDVVVRADLGSDRAHDVESAKQSAVLGEPP